MVLFRGWGAPRAKVISVAGGLFTHPRVKSDESERKKGPYSLTLNAFFPYCEPIRSRVVAAQPPETMLFLLDRRRFGEKSAFPPRAPHLARALRAATTPLPPSPPSQSTWLPTSPRKRAARRLPPTCVSSPAAIASRVAMRFRPPRRCVDRLVGGPIGASLGDAARANAPAGSLRAPPNRAPDRVARLPSA